MSTAAYLVVNCLLVKLGRDKHFWMCIGFQIGQLEMEIHLQSRTLCSLPEYLPPASWEWDRWKKCLF